MAFEEYFWGKTVGTEKVEVGEDAPCSLDLPSQVSASAFPLPLSSEWSSALVTVMIITGPVEPSPLPAASPAALSGQEEGCG